MGLKHQLDKNCKFQFIEFFEIKDYITKKER